MNTETRDCQNCQRSFLIEPEDFDFYAKIKVPFPTFCPECRLVRRLMWRNERTLYKAACAKCNAPIFSAYPAESNFPIYCHDCWFSDSWDPMEYGMPYDFSKPFFQQFEEALLARIPRFSLYQRNCTRSPFANLVVNSKDVYLSYSIVECEEVFYSKNVDESVRVFDSLNVTNSEKCFEVIYGVKDYNSHHLLSSDDCIDSGYLYQSRNSQKCFLSANLRNGEYILRNTQESKDSYAQEVKKLMSGSYEGEKKLREEFMRIKNSAIHRHANFLKTVNSTGDNLANAKNAKYTFDGYELEDVRYLFRAFQIKDSMDVCYAAVNCERIYEYISGGTNNQNVSFSVAGLTGLSNVSYAAWCGSSSNIFGCMGLRNKQYCILNRQYTKEEYETLMPKIIEHMHAMPYKGKNGRDYGYGEFFPVELSPFAYNESIAQEYFPLAKEEAVERGYRWRDREEKNYQVTLAAKDLPDNIKDVADDILKQTIGCPHAGKCFEQCTAAFRIVPEELQMYRANNFPLPRLCPNCRHYERLAQKNPLKLWHRQCMCDYSAYANSVKHAHHEEGRCPNEFETSYAPDRPEIVYCEQCYQAEVA